MLIRRFAAIVVLAWLCPGGTAVANTSHAGWPLIDGIVLINKTDSFRPLDARPGHDPFEGTDPTYSCDAIHRRGTCQRLFTGCPPLDLEACLPGSLSVAAAPVHNELLGGHGSDTIYAGPLGDVLWGDFKSMGQPRNQIDQLVGGPGKDFIYASHGTNVIDAGAGPDHIKAHYGRGLIDCGPGRDMLYISHRAYAHYRISNCETITFSSLGY